MPVTLDFHRLVSQVGHAQTKAKEAPARREPTESRAAETLTVGWMLSVVTALVCEVASAAANLLAPPKSLMALLAEYLLFAALVIGGVALLLTPLVFKLRRQPPPRGVTVFSLVVGATPFVVVMLRLLR